MTNKDTTAFPAQAAQDSLGKIFTPFPGFTKEEYVLLQFALTGVSAMTHDEELSNEQLADAVMIGARELTEAYFRALEKTQQKKESLTIIR